MTDRVIVFLDYQNVYQCAREVFHHHLDPHWCGQVNPVKLGLHLAADSPFDRELTQVRIYRGQPVGDRDPRGFAASHRQHAAWQRDPRVHLVTRPLRYPRGWPTVKRPGERPQEKGIDVALTLDYAVMAVRDEYDVGILFSVDTDLKPALEFVASSGLARAEVAAWSAQGQHTRRLSISGRRLYCHWVDQDVYKRIQDPINYALPKA